MISMKYISFIKNIIVLMWQRHHFLIPPKYWKKYLNSFYRKLSMKREYYNPFILKEYNAWLVEQHKNEEIFLKKRPLISFVIPVYNIEKNFLVDCLESILKQSYQNFEVCLADDNSTNEETIKTLKDYHIKLFF